MYRDKPAFRVRPLCASLEDIASAASLFGDRVAKVFVADGDALVMDMEHWDSILRACRKGFPQLRQVSTYATAANVLDKTDAELRQLRELGLKLLYIGPESGDDETLKRIAKGATYDDHARAAQRAHAAGMKISAIFLLGAGGVERTEEHAHASARLATAMDPEYLAAMTLTILSGTPIAELAASKRFVLPDVRGLLRELRILVGEAQPSDALFRTNHASNFLNLGGRLPRDRDRITALIDEAMAGVIPLRDQETPQR